MTVNDVAKRAQVSKATAARVLGGYGGASEDVRRRVTAAAKALDYKPNELARSMTTGKSGTIGVVVGDIENSFFGLAVRGISDVAHANGFNVILANSGENIEAEKSALEVLVGKRVDGLIVTPAHSGDTAHLKAVVRSGRPLVLLDRSLPGFHVDTVVVDDRDAAFNATSKLTEAGHRRIAYVSAVKAAADHFPDGSPIAISSVLERVEGFLDACRQAGIADPERWIRRGGTNEPDRLRAVVTALMSEPDHPTAILASDSVIALEIFKTLQIMKIPIPAAVSLISFHDADWTSVTNPPVTVIDQPIYAMGRKVAEILIDRVNGDTAPAAFCVMKTRLIERQSVAAPP
ncbi:MAG: LacI family DNA-binding transcriptional regulator [Azospirillaceae bacterium]|nr:LacI family DNA-binding transcriptional regulator [Azospirillaceae bacterium]